MVEKYIGAVSGKIQTWQVEQQHNQQMAKEKREKERNDERRLGREPKATAELLANSKCPTVGNCRSQKNANKLPEKKLW